MTDAEYFERYGHHRPTSLWLAAVTFPVNVALYVFGWAWNRATGRA